MQVQVSRWGNSLGVRLPKELAQRLGIGEGSRVEVSEDRGRIVIPVERPVYTPVVRWINKVFASLVMTASATQNVEGEPIGGLKVTTENAWFAARPSGTEDVYKIYAESFLGADHLKQVQDAARELVSSVLG